MRTRPIHGLRDDNRGAIMMTGLFMAFFLVGALWFVIGIGDAIIFRDRMQEAADHAAFTSAALHAKGMNFISAINLIMLVLVVIHIVLGIIHDLLLAACMLTGVACIAYVPARNTYTGYAQVMKPTLTVLAWSEKIAAWGYPWIGSVKGYSVGSTYGNQGRVEDVHAIPISPSNIPGLVGTGLPVGALNFDYLCLKVSDVVTDFGVGVATSVFPGWLESFIDLPGGTSMGKVKRLFKRLMGAVIQVRYCNDLGQGGKDPNLVSKMEDMVKARDAIERENQARAGRNRDNRRSGGSLEEMIPGFDIDRTSGAGSPGGWSSLIDPGFDKGWGNEGPMVVSAGAGNGTLAHQVWAVNFNPKYRDTNDRRVSIPSEIRDRNFAVDSDQGPKLGYTAQAEFFFDCAGGWYDPECNDEDNNATFALKWRARLHRTEIPNLLGLLVNYAFNSVSGAAIDAIDKILEDKLKGVLGSGAVASVGIQAIKNFVLGHIYGLQGTVNDKVNDITNPNSPALGVYH